MARTRRCLVGVLLALLAAIGIAVPARAADPVPPFIPPEASWLTTVNYFRAMAGLPSVTEDTTLNAGAYNHSCYMLYNGITHTEVPGLPGYTDAGYLAGRASNVAVSSAYGTTARSHIELWMTGPFHAIGILRHNLARVGFGKCDLQTTPTAWHSAATLDVLDGLVSRPRPSAPILFPGNGTTTSLSKFVTESPNPLQFCGWTGDAGLPLIAMMPTAVTTVSATLFGPVTPTNTGSYIPVCSLYAGNTTGDASAILKGDNAVTVVPRYVLSSGTYTARVVTNSGTVSWSFTVDPTAATGVEPVPTVLPAGGASAYHPVTPFRFADSRIPLRITRYLAGTIKKVRVADGGWIPTTATAISVNFTAVNSSVPVPWSTYITVYPSCSMTPPTASTLNIYPGQAVANAGIVPLSPDGYLCFMSPYDTDLIIDINGYFTASDTTSYNAITPVPLIDTTTGLGGTERLPAETVTRINVRTAGIGVPSTATAVGLVVTGAYPARNSYITAYPCDAPTMPAVSSVNPILNSTRSNFALVPLSASGELCLFNLVDVDMMVDVIGYFTPTGPGSFVPTAPTRVTDTRDRYRSEMNMGTGGDRLPAGTIGVLDLRGHRGVPDSVRAMSFNVTVVAPTAPGSIVVSACGTSPPVASISFDAGRTTPSGMQVAFSTDGKICVKATTPIHLVIDVTGWWN